MNTDCPICCAPYNKSTAKRITCPRHDCGESACKSCVKTYLLGSNSDPHCLHCRVAWDNNFLIQNLSLAFLKKDYANHRGTVLFDREQARIPDTQNEVVQYRQVQDLRKQNYALTTEMKELRERLRLLEREEFNRRNLIEDMINGKGKVKVEHRAFVMPCPETDCKGYLSTAYKCASCSKFACPHCLVVLGEEKDLNHECDPDVVATVEQIKKETKGCPKCGERIGKISGCDQMWCPKCTTPFSWRTGKIESGTIHNPHYFQWARQNAVDGVIARQPGDRGGGGPCGLAIQWRVYETFSKYLKLTYFCDTIINANQCSTHLNEVTIRGHQVAIQRYNDHTKERVKYIVGDLSEDAFKMMLKTDDIKRKQLTDLVNIYQLFAHATGDIINNFIASMSDGLPLNLNGTPAFPKVNTPESTNADYLRRGQYYIAATDELNALACYTNNQLANYSSIYGTTVHRISLDHHRGYGYRGEKYSKIGAETFIKGNTLNSQDDRVYFKRQIEVFMQNPMQYSFEPRS